jgi:competence protein ComEC
MSAGSPNANIEASEDEGELLADLDISLFRTRESADASVAGFNEARADYMPTPSVANAPRGAPLWKAAALNGGRAVLFYLAPFFAALLGGITRPAEGVARARVDLVLWLPIFLALGIGLWFSLRFEPTPLHYMIVATALVTVIIVWIRMPPAGQFLCASLSLACLGFLLAGAQAHRAAAPVLQFRYYGPVEGRIVGVDRSGTDRIRLTLDQPRLDRLAPDLTPKKIRVALQEAPGEGAQAWLDPIPGQRVILTAHLLPVNGPVWPGGYDFRRKSWFEQIGAVGYTRTPVLLLDQADPSDWALAAHGFRMRVSKGIQDQIGGQAGAMAAALLVGDRSGISVATNEIMRGSNLFHIIAISGLHMGMLTGFVFAALRYGIALVPRVALRVPAKKIAAVGALIAATIYLWISGMSVATERAYIMAGVMLMAVLLDRRALSLRTVALAALLILLIAPENLVEPGFQMSFGATVALILMAGPWGRIAQRLPAVVRPVGMLVATSFIAGMVTAPIAAAHFNRMAEYGVLANLFAVPVMGTLVMPAGVIAALFAPLGLAALPLWVMGKGTAWIIYVGEKVSALDGAVMALPTPPGWVLPLLATGALAMVLGRGAGRSLAGIAVIFAFGAWLRVTPAPLLIAPEGELVGVMTEQGRAVSKSAAGFVASNWLNGDGDAALPETAFERPLFSGPSAARVATWAGGEIVHLTGKTAQDRLPAVCTEGRLVVIAAQVDRAAGPCVMIDRTSLKATGALAIFYDDTAGGDTGLRGRLKIVTARSETGDRLWTR